MALGLDPRVAVTRCQHHAVGRGHARRIDPIGVGVEIPHQNRRAGLGREQREQLPGLRQLQVGSLLTDQVRDDEPVGASVDRRDDRAPTLV